MRVTTPRDNRFFIRRIRFSTITAMRTDGIHDVCLYEENATGEYFFSIIMLCPSFGCHSVIIIENVDNPEEVAWENWLACGKLIPAG
jgi:hypothetical protein